MSYELLHRLDDPRLSQGLLSGSIDEVFSIAPAHTHWRENVDLPECLT